MYGTQILRFAMYMLQLGSKKARGFTCSLPRANIDASVRSELGEGVSVLIHPSAYQIRCLPGIQSKCLADAGLRDSGQR